ncbi:MAG: hypothetical protein ACE5GR_06615 [Nitrosopumilus sp.]
MAIEKWLAITSVGLFAMFAGEMIALYNFMIEVPADFEFAQVFDANPKIIQFVSIGAGPAGILAGVAFIMSKHYGSKPIGAMIIVGGIILFVGMIIINSMLPKIPDEYATYTVKHIPLLFMMLSALVVAVGAYLIKHQKPRPKKQYF